MINNSTGSDRNGNTVELVYIFLVTVFGYVVLQTLAELTSYGLLKAVSYVAALGIVMAMSVLAAYRPKAQEVPLGLGIALLLYYYGFFGSALVNLAVLDYGTAMKMMLVPLFLLVGAVFESQNRFRAWENLTTKWLFGLLIALPFAVWLWQLGTNRIEFGGIGGVSIFANRNNAALYAVMLLALLNVLRPQPLKNLVVYCVVGAVFGTLGVLLAVLVSLVLVVGGGRAILLLGTSSLAIGGFLYLVPLEFGVFSRIKHVLASIKLIVEGRIDIATVTYGDLVTLLNTTDLSFLFRIKHWNNLLAIYSNAPIENIVFGFGVGGAIRQSNEGLMPHNDYIRVLFECGPVTLAGFVTLLVLIIRNCGRRWETIPLLTVVLYFFTENLIDNFVAMILFFFCGGALAHRIRSGRMASKCA